MIVEFPTSASSGVPRPHYYHAYYLAIRECLETGLEVVPANIHGPIAVWHVGDKRIRTLFDYADDPGLSSFPGGMGADLVFKLKYCTRHQGHYDYWPVPVVPGGFPILGTAPFVSNRKSFFEKLPWYREQRDACIKSGKWKTELLTRGVFFQSEINAERKRLFDPRLNQGGKNTVPFLQHMRDVARSKVVLNICGSSGHHTVDRKIFDFSAVGGAILTDRGLRDFVLPRGGRFVDSENVVYIDSAQEIIDRAEDMTHEEVVWLTRGSRDTFDASCSPKALCRYWREEVEKLC